MKNHLTISNIRKICKIPFSEIIHIKSNGMCTTVHTDVGSHSCSKNLKEIHQELNGSKMFFRVHTSHIVSFHKIKEYQKVKNGLIIMVNGAKIPVAKRRKTDFIEWYKKK